MASDPVGVTESVRQCLAGAGCKGLAELSSALLTPVIGITTAYVAYQQFRVNKTRLKLEQYERRLAVYKAIDAFYADVAIAGTAKYSDVAKLRTGTAEAEFLFPRAVTKHLSDLYAKGLRMATLHELMYPSSGEGGLPVGEG